MKYVLTILSFLIFSISAFAETYTCSFEEFVLTFTYDTKTQELVVTSPELEGSQVVASLQIKDQSSLDSQTEITLIDKKTQEAMLILKLDNKGSDGEITNYPYSALLDDEYAGGCYSTQNPLNNN